ncbi:hypothetical protein W97_06414 [Coniosporium apollinis CBS 100218]|uniref:Actin-crosslinking protein n=1 Tax=Coniosporium apollinis (strain CBS 100218) TaxID=1168221 RepID=R7YZU2_CONA1|nr:uncharacterized protein W97_06414 [Coniosporium apollinis CBS 100218]EON67161.1 hypothetical protein W97_06414 [Coniosporium apollinis CBS 100218]
MVKALTFKGDKKPKKRKRAPTDDNDAESTNPTSQALQTTSTAPITAPTDTAEEDNSWVSADAVTDVSGPIIFVLPSEPPTCLACDSIGKVFAIPVENIVDDDPSTAEPHDVRQVWIANRVAGTESYSFKGHHGRYLGVEKFGALSATTEAISPTESFTVVPVPDQRGAFAVQTAGEKFIAAQEAKGAVEVRADAEAINFSTTLRIRMQARFKPRLRASKEEKAREKISRKELEDMVGRRLEDGEVKMLKRARREGNFHEKMLDVKVKNKHDKFA